jgi:hypothetical protein
MDKPIGEGIKKILNKRKNKKMGEMSSRFLD